MVSTERYKQIDEAAGNWLARRDSGDWTAEDQSRFDQWLSESPLNRVAYLRIEHAWERSERLKALGAGTPRGVVPPPNAWNLSPFFEPREGAGPHKYPQHWRRVRLIATAAVLVLSATVGTAYYLWPSGTSYQTPVGGLASVPMSDGSKITLNTDSEIRVSITETERRIELEHGEAFFEVVHDPARPFIVHAGSQRVVAVGTKFSVRRDMSDIKVIVTEGKVRVENRKDRKTHEEAAADAVSSDPGTMLPAGTVAQASDEGVLLQTTQLAEAEESLSWRHGVLVFRQMTLADASAEFNRYNTRKIVIEDSDVASLHVAGSFRANNVEAFVRLLERGYPLRAEERGDEIVLTAR